MQRDKRREKGKPRAINEARQERGEGREIRDFIEGSGEKKYTERKSRSV